MKVHRTIMKKQVRGGDRAHGVAGYAERLCVHGGADLPGLLRALQLPRLRAHVRGPLQPVRAFFLRRLLTC